MRNRALGLEALEHPAELEWWPGGVFAKSNRLRLIVLILIAAAILNGDPLIHASLNP
jgi:hypothetical protein